MELAWRLRKWRQRCIWKHFSNFFFNIYFKRTTTGVEAWEEEAGEAKAGEAVEEEQEEEQEAVEEEQEAVQEEQEAMEEAECRAPY